MVLNSANQILSVCISVEVGVSILTPYLVLYNTPIPVKNETKFLGTFLDSKQTFVPHIKGHKKKCVKALNL